MPLLNMIEKLLSLDAVWKIQLLLDKNLAILVRLKTLLLIIIKTIDFLMIKNLFYVLYNKMSLWQLYLVLQMELTETFESFQVILLYFHHRLFLETMLVLVESLIYYPVQVQM